MSRPSFRSLASLVCGALVLTGVQALGVVTAPPARAAVAVALATPTTLHGDGAELSWTRFVPDAGVAFGSYEVHRSATAAFTPSAATRLTAIRDIALTRWRDTTAKPSTAFSYRVVADGTVSNEVRVTLPGAGLATKTLQPAGSAGKATYVARDTTTPAACYDDYNYGSHTNLRTGTSISGVIHRPLLKFDLRDIPAAARVSSATLTLSYGATAATGVQVNVHRVKQPWKEGTGTGQCNATGATWNLTENGLRWKYNGGSIQSTAHASVAAKSRSVAGTDAFALTSLVQTWVNGTPNHGLMVKLASEAIPTTAEQYFNYYSDDHATASVRPKLTITYADGGVARAPRVSVVAPSGDAPVRGTAVPLTASAGDDGAVSKVEFLVDGVVVSTDTAAPWSGTWNSTTAAAGAHTVTARATDNAGNVATSAARSVTVDNSAAPTAVVTAPAAAASVKGTVTVTANATDDLGVSYVEFAVDGERIGSDSVAPYSVAWNTLDALSTAYDGPHTLTATAYDTGGQATTSAAVGVTVANTAGTSFKASYDLNALGQSDDPFAVPPTILGNELAPASDPSTDPSSGTGGSLEKAPSDDTNYSTSTTSSMSSSTELVPPPPDPVSAHAFQADVTVTNDSAVAWKGGDLALWYRWYTPDGVVLFEGPGTDYFPQTVQPGQSKRIPVTVEPPAVPVGTDLAQVRLRFDVYDSGATTLNKWFAGRGNKPVDNPVIVERALEGALGLEKWWQYEGEQAGAGMTTMSNVANGNMLLRWSPFHAPGRGISTLVDLTYNSLEDHSESPAGNNFSLAISGLTRWGYGLDIHPNKADEISGKSRKYVVVTDGDGTTHEFKGTTDAAGVTRWTEPPGVNLYLRSSNTADTTRRWALTRPDNVTFWFDADGYPTAVVDRNGNTLTFVLQDTPPGEDPGGPKRRIVRVVDAAGRAFDVDYWSKAEAKKAHVRGKIQRITDHSGSALDFDYYDDGNLLRLTQRGGTTASGALLADRSFVFTYTVPNGSGPAIADPALRVNPEPRTMSQSTRLFSVRDPRGAETTFAYYGPSEGAKLRWKLKSRTNRAGKTTTFTYDYVNRRTTVDAPLSRDTEFAYDTIGRPTAIVDALEQVTGVAWTTDNKVSQVTEPSGKLLSYTYNANGYLTSRTDQLGNKTELTYTNRSIDALDVAGHWSLLATRTTARGVATPTDPTDFRWTFTYDAAGNLDKSTDPESYVTDHDWNLAGSAHPGTVAQVTDPNLNVTKYEYDPSGQPSKITDGENQVTQFGYDVDGNVVWVQDPRHVGDSGTDVRAYRTYFDYDSFHRMGRQSSPKSTAIDRGRLIWSGAVYDPNDNVVKQVEPHYAGVVDDDEAAPVRTASYDAMDRLTTQANPDTTHDALGERTTYEYDDAGRMVKTTRPKGVLTTTVADDYTTVYAYDVLDRAIREIRYGASTADERRVHMCYDLAGDLRSVTSPRAGLATVACPATNVGFTTTYTYDAAHRQTATRDPLGHESRTFYDENGNVVKEERDIAAGRMTRVERRYDERDLPIRTEELFNGVTGREVVALLEYDGNGNKVRSISARGFDAAGGVAPFDHYVTRYSYDKANRLKRVDLPYDGRDGTERQYVHRWYDAGGNITATSFPVTTLDPAQVKDSAKTLMTYYDPTWLRTSKKPTDPQVEYDYAAQGWQVRKSPDVKGKPGTVDTDREQHWEFFADGKPKSRKAGDGNPSTYKYDANNNLTNAVDASGVTEADDTPVETEATFTGFDEPDRVRHRRQGTTTWKFSDYDYDANGNVAQRLENGEETSTGQTKAPRTHKMTYDAADWLTEQLDLGVDAACKDDQRIVNEYWSTGWEKRREVDRAGATCTADVATWPTKQVTTWDHNDNGKLSKLVTTNATGAVTESHDVEYMEGTRYENGHRTIDRFVLKRADTKAGVTKCLSATPCVADYDYDARGKVLRHQKREGDVATYKMDEPAYLLVDNTIRGGNVTTQVDDGETQVRKYESNQLKHITVGTATVDYLYDNYGEVDCVTLGATSTTCPTGGSNLVTDYAYDDLERLAFQKSYSAGTVTDSAEYTYDALDRVTKEVETHNDGGANNRTTNFTFQGLSDLVTEEKQSGGTNPKTKTFSYDAYGHRISMTDKENTTTKEAETFTYGYDVHGSVSQLLADSGAVRASYGYDAYGGQDSPDNAADGLTTGDLDDKNPLNPYRYTGKRLDSGSATATKAASSMDMGARRYGVDTGRFVQDDMYSSALGDLGLTADPLTMNRYALAGGNPVSFVEVDGHMVIADGGGGGSTTPTPDADGRDGQDSGDYESLVGEFANEINHNMREEIDTIKSMNETINYYLSDEPAWWERIFQPDIGSLTISALSAWTSKVCQRICEWDHKPEIRADYGMGKDGKDLYTEVPGTGKEIYYDIWSNIHYGYVGRAAGFDAETLMSAQASNIPVVGSTDAGDNLSVQVGIDLYERYGEDGLTAEALDSAVRSHLSEWESLDDWRVRSVP